MELLKLYEVTCGTKSYKTISGYFKAIEDAEKARVALIEREFPSWKKTRTWGSKTWGRRAYQITHPSSKCWGVRPPSDKSGLMFPIPPEWRPMRWCYAYRPSKGTKRGRELRAEMESLPVAPTKWDLCEWLGLTGHSRWVEIETVNSRRFVIALNAKATALADCMRISDIEFEKLMTKKRKAVAS